MSKKISVCYNSVTFESQFDKKIKEITIVDKIISPEIRSFLEKLLSDKKINATGELKDQMVSDLNDRLEVRFNQLVIEHLSIQELDALAEVAEEGPEAVQQFLRKNIKNIDALFAEAMQQFAQAYLEG
ncbi:MAG TPA: hypothetical protein VFX17_01290 [Patescibacteria group bacterium]|nr:hypothetical protein [Patescibacteria group bacterium]